MAPKELLTLRLLMDNPQGLYGSELVHLSKGGLPRGTIYVLLERMVDKGWVSEQEEEPTAALSLRRTRHFATKKGTRVCEEFARTNGLSIIAGALAAG